MTHHMENMEKYSAYSIISLLYTHRLLALAPSYNSSIQSLWMIS